MNISQLSQLVVKHARGALVEPLYLRAGIDVTRPTVVYAIVNERCNYRCRYCEYWRMQQYADEMTVDQWTDALGSLQQFIGTYHVEFSGGEPFLKRGFLDILRFCRQRKIRWGVTTNGSALSEKTVRQIVAADPFNINISIDGHRPEIHDYMRGVPGSLERIVRGIGLLMQHRDQQSRDFPIIIKPTVHAKNFRQLPDLVRWAQRLGVTAVNFQPVDRWTPETHDELWIEQDRHAELEQVVAELIALKRAGAPILNTETVLKLWTSHFREETAPPEALPCRVGLRNFFIRPNGDVELCWYYPPIGNVKTQTARDIWYSPAARERRRETVQCTRLCLFTCLSQKTLWDKAKMALTLLKGDRISQPCASLEPETIESQTDDRDLADSSGSTRPVDIDPPINSLPVLH